MKKWTTGWRGRVLLAFMVWLALTGITTWNVFVTGMADGTTHTLTIGELIMRLFKWPVIFAFASFSVAWAYAFTDAQAAQVAARQVAQQQAQETQEREQQEAQEKAHHTFAAQVVGVQWLNPLMWMDYSTEWNLLWTLGLAKPNKDDEQVKTEPESYGKVQTVAAIASNMFGKETFNGFFKTYIEELFIKFHDRYVMNGTYFYTVHSKNAKDWREVAGMHVEAALPTTLDIDKSTSFIRDEIADQFAIGKIKQELSSSDTPPDVRVTQGGPSAGFTSLSAALDYLEAHPDKTVWVMSFDAPSFPQYKKINESAVLLILAHPSYKTEREPLAWIQRVSTRQAKDFEVQAGHSSRQVQAWHAAIADAADRGALQPTQIGYVIHDAGTGSEASSKRIGTLAQALTETIPEFDFLKQTFNSTALLGNLGASSALTDIALGITYAYHKNVPVLVAGTSDTDTATTVLIRPPANPRPFDPDKTWFRARGQGNAYLPWWGRRFDEKRNLLQGWSE